MALMLTDPLGKVHKTLVESGKNRVPSWVSDSKHIVWMESKAGRGPSANSKLWIMNTETLESRPLFSDAQQMKHSNSMPVVSPTANKVAFVSNRSGNYRIWVSNLDGSEAKLISLSPTEEDETLKLPIEQKVPAWSPDGKCFAHWEGVEMLHLSHFTGKKNPARDKQITETWHVWVVDSSGQNKRKAGRGDDPNWSPAGFVTRSFPDQKKGGAKIMIETKQGWKELPIVPPKTTSYGRFTWKP